MALTLRRSSTDRLPHPRVWDRDMYTVPADQLKDLTCELTLLRGRTVYQAGGK